MLMMKKKTYIVPLVETLHLGLPSILAGTNGTNSSVKGDNDAVIGGGGSGGYIGGDDETGLSRRSGGFWDEE
jgi:hypothetical protein